MVHLCTLLDKLGHPAEREWYLRAAAEHGWSRAVLVMQIETRAIERFGKAQKNKVIAEYALRDSNKPIGVAEYQLVGEALPKDLEASLPSIEQIERELGEVES